jgi:hypothetical protein
MSQGAARRAKHAPDYDDVRSQVRILLFYPAPGRRDLGIVDCPASNSGFDRSEYATVRANEPIKLPNRPDAVICHFMLLLRLLDPSNHVRELNGCVGRDAGLFPRPGRIVFDRLR